MNFLGGGAPDRAMRRKEPISRIDRRRIDRLEAAAAVGRPARRALLAALLIALAAGCGASETDPAPAAAAAASSPRPEAAPLGEGFVVWESNRSGRWRIWSVRLDGGGLRQLSPEEGGRDHCCPHVSPDGRRLVYLSTPASDRPVYDGDGSRGELRLIGADGRGDRTLAAAARSYFENRAAIWRDASSLTYLTGDGATVLLDVDSGESERLLGPSAEGHGWLVDPTLRHAVSGTSGFGVYDPKRRAVAVRSKMPGCQPYLSHDGRRGYWMAGAGGPVDSIDLASGAVSTLIRKSDPRLPDGLGYVYFPMLSSDATLFAFAASADQHDHFKSDYEVFVAEVDPDDLTLVGSPVRLTEHPATDRYPDVYREPLALGRLRGEAPFTVRLEAGEGAGWRWDFGDGATGSGALGEHTFERPGSYEVTARLGQRERRGLVTVAAPRPPRPTAVELRRRGAELVVHFDEEVEIGGARARLDSGLTLSAPRLAAGGRSVVFEPATPIRRPDQLRLEGIVDRAGRPNAMAPATLAVEPPLWPSSREGLVFLWETGDAPNLVFDPGLGAERAATLRPSGGARLDHDFAMALDGGAFVAPDDESALVFASAKRTNEISIQALVRTPAEVPPRPAVIAALAANRDRWDFFLEQRGDRLTFSIKVGPRGPESIATGVLMPLPPGRASHVAVTYRPGRLVGYLDGVKAAESSEIQGDFFHWRSVPLAFGALPNGDREWGGGLEGVAIYDRILAPEEVAEDFLRYREKLAARREVARVVVEARERRRSRPPTLEEISPYREALAVHEYEVERVVEGELNARVVRVAQWSILDGRPLEPAQAEAGRRLVLEPFAENPQLESVYLADTLGPGGGPLFYAVRR